MTLKPGTYNARASHATLGYTKDGKEQVGVELLVLDDDFQGERITWFGYFTEASSERTLESLRLLGWKGDDLFDLQGIDENQVSIVVVEDEYQGKTQIKVRWINAPGGMAMKAPMSDTQAREFSARRKGAVRAFKQKSGTPKPAGNASNSRRQSSQGADAPPPDDKDLW